MRKNLYPLRLEATFFSKVEFQRVGDLPDPLNVNIDYKVKINASKFPDLEIWLAADSREKEPFALQLELLGIFKPIPEEDVTDQSVIEGFVNDQALFMLWPYLVQMTRQVTSFMGMNPLNIPYPHTFDINIVE